MNGLCYKSWRNSCDYDALFRCFISLFQLISSHFQKTLTESLKDPQFKNSIIKNLKSKIQKQKYIVQLSVHKSVSNSISRFFLTNQRSVLPTYRNQQIDLQSKPIGWFLYVGSTDRWLVSIRWGALLVNGLKYKISYIQIPTVICWSFSVSFE